MTEQALNSIKIDMPEQLLVFLL